MSEFEDLRIQATATGIGSDGLVTVVGGQRVGPDAWPSAGRPPCGSGVDAGGASTTVPATEGA